MCRGSLVKVTGVMCEKGMGEQLRREEQGQPGMLACSTLVSTLVSKHPAYLGPARDCKGRAGVDWGEAEAGCSF